MNDYREFTYSCGICREMFFEPLSNMQFPFHHRCKKCGDMRILYENGRIENKTINKNF